MTYRLAHHPLVLRATLQAFLVRQAFIRDDREKLAAWHLYWTQRNLWEKDD